MTDVNANISIDIDSSAAISNLKRLESQINKFQRSINAANTTALANQASWSRQLLQSINATGQFTAKIVDVEDSVSRFSRTLEKNKFTLGEYTRLAASQMPGMSRVFTKEFDTIQKVAESRIKSIATQFIALRDTVDGATRAIAITPTGLAKGYSTDIAVAAERQKIFNKLIDDGSTKLLNWGKNTQWAGRQLMVGFSIPLAALGTVAAKTFMEIDKANLSLRRVYGDLSTTTAEIDSNIEAIQKLGKAYTKYGISLAETTDIAARAAATGAQNETLLAATEETLRFATLGQIDYNQALDSTIALQTAFGISNDQLANKIDFLNAVENQTILTIDDMSLAIPRVATVVKGLGGDIEDLAVMMTAMREGGVSAENAANALKSGLASLINPTKRARESLAGMNIDIKAMVNANKGDLMGLITDFANATNALDEFSRQQVFEQVFGKYQYARMSALFTNITKDAGQAARAMELAGMSAQELAAISEKELGAIADTTSVKFQAALETLKVEIAPIGEAFLKGLTPIVELASKLLDAFNNLPDGIKNAIAVTTAVVGGLGPVFLMLAGLIGNGVANIVKGVQFMRRSIARIKGDAEAFNYLSDAEHAALLASEKLQGGTAELTSKLLLQERAVESLTAAYSRFATVAGIAGGAMAAVPAGGAVAGSGQRPALVRPTRLAFGGTVPGTGNKDTIPALLTPGESVITKQATQQYGPIIDAMNKGRLPGFNKGVTGVQYFGNKSQTGGPGGEVINYVHKSHLLGLQSQETISSLRQAWLQSQNNPSMRSQMIDSFSKLFGSGGSNIYYDKTTGEYRLGSRGRLQGSSSQPLSQQELVDRINDFLGLQPRTDGYVGLTRLNPIGYRGVAIPARGQKNSVFVESRLLPENVRGGDAVTLSEFNEHVKYAKIMTDAKQNGNAQLLIQDDGTIVGSKDKKIYGKTTPGERKVRLKPSTITGAEQIISEFKSMSAKGIKTDKDFIQNRIYQLLATGAIDVSPNMTQKEKQQLNQKFNQLAQDRTNELQQLGLIDQNGKVDDKKLSALKGMILSQSMGLDPGDIGLNPQFHRWIGTSLPKTALSGNKFRELISATGGLNIGSRGHFYGRVTQSTSRFLGLPKNKGGIIPGYNNGGLIQYFSNNPDPVSQTKALTGKQKFLRRLLESWVGKPVSMDERAVTNVLRTMPGGAEGERYSAGPLYRGFRNRPGDLLPPKVEELIKTAKYGLTEEARQAAARELVGMEFATEPRSWTTDYDVSTRFGPHTMELSQMEGGQFGLDVNKHMPEGNFFAGEKEFVPLEESGRRLILRISSVDLNDPSGVPISSGFSGSIPEGARLGIKVERVTDLSNTRRKKMERELDERIIARRGSLLGRKSKEAKAERRQEIVDYTGAKAKIRDEIFQWMQDIESGQRRYNSWSDWWTESHEAIAHQLFGQENFREFQRAIDRDEWPERMPNVAGSTRKQTLEIVRKIREKGMQGANLGGLIQRFADGGDVAAFMNNPIFQSDKRRYVPGVGNTDTVPAMLTPGEFVINKKATAENLPLLKAINNGKSVGMNKGGYIRGIQYFYGGGDVDESPKEAYSPSQSHLTGVRSVYGEEALAYARLSGQKLVKEMLDKVEEGLINAEDVRARLYTNAIINEPYLANEQMMTAAESAKLFKENPRKVAEPLTTGITDALEKSSVTITEEIRDQVDKAGSDFVSGLASEYERFGDELVKDVDRERAARRVLERMQASGSISRPVLDAMGRVFDEATAVFFTVRGEELLGRSASGEYGLGRVAVPSRGTTRLSSYRSRSINNMPDWQEELPSVLTDEGNKKRQEQERRRLERSQSRARRSGLDAAKESLKTSNEEKSRAIKARKLDNAIWDLTNRERKEIKARVEERLKYMAFVGDEDRQRVRQEMIQAEMNKEIGKRKSKLIAQEREFLIKRGVSYELATNLARQRVLDGKEELASEVAARRERAKIMQKSQTEEMPQTSLMPIGTPDFTQEEYDPRQQRQTRRQRVSDAVRRGSGKLFGLGAGMQMAGTIPMMAANEQGKFLGMDANQLSTGLFLGGTAAEILPLILPKLISLISNPVGATIAAIVAAGGAFLLMNKMANDVVERGTTFSKSMIGASDSIDKVAEIFGKQTWSDKLSQRIADKAAGAKATAEVKSIAQQFVASEQGGQLVASYQTAKDFAGGAQANKGLAIQLERMVLAGAFGPRIAAQIATEIGKQLGDQSISADVTAKLKDVIGLDGKSLSTTEGRLKIFADIIAETANVQEAFKNAGLIWDGESWYSQVAMVVMRRGTEGIAGENAAQNLIESQKILNEELAYQKILLDDGKISYDEYDKAVTDIVAKSREAGATWSGVVDAFNKKYKNDPSVLAIALDKFNGKLLESTYNTLQFSSKNQESFNKLLENVQNFSVQYTDTLGRVQVINTDLFNAEDVRQNIFGLKQEMLDAASTVSILQERIAQLPEGTDRNFQLQQLMQYQKYLTEVSAAYNKLKPQEQGMMTFSVALESGVLSETTIAKLLEDPTFDLPELTAKLGIIPEKDAMTVLQMIEMSGGMGSTVTYYLELITSAKPSDKETADLLMGITGRAAAVGIKLNIDLITSLKDPERKNALAIVDKEIKNLEKQFSDKKTTKGLKEIEDFSKEKNVKKKDVYEKTVQFITTFKNSQGKNIKPNDVNKALSDVLVRTGMTKEQFYDLPPDVAFKTLMMSVNAKSYLDAAIAARIAANRAGKAGDTATQAIMTRQADAFNAVYQAFAGGAAAGAQGAAGGAETPPETPSPGPQGGSGGGGKTDPFKDLKKSIMDRLKMFTDFAALMKKYKSSKDGFMKAVQEATVGRGVAGKLRNLGLDENFVQDILSAGLENAQKVLDKLEKNRRQAQALNLAYIKGAAGDELSRMQTDTGNTKNQVAAFTKIQRFNAANPNQQIPDYVRDAIASSPALSALATKIKVGSKDWNTMVNGIKAYTQEAEKLENLKDPNLAKEEALNLMKRQHELNIRANKERIKGLQDEISEIDKQIAAINRLNEKDQNRIRDLQREKEIRQREIDNIQRTIDSMQRANEMDERRIERLRREDAIRSRIADALSNDLEIMSQQEETIRKQYQERIDALEEVNKLNDHIVESQKQQLGLAQALSQGDVYAAAAAAQEMEASQGRYAREQQSAALQQGMENQISGLTTPGGLTRQQAEEQINAIRQQSYQTSLQIRDIEDVIYQRNLDMIPLKDQIYNKTLLQQGTDAAILAIQDLIYDRETNILKLREKQEPILARLRNEEDILKTLDDQFNSTYDNAMALIEQDRVTEALNKGTIALTKNWNNVGKAISNANEVLNNTLAKLGAAPKPEDYPNTDEGRAQYKTELDKWNESRKKAIQERNAAANAAMNEGAANDASIRAGMYAGGSVKKYPMGGSVIGAGARDSVKAMLTPGEFVIRKSMVDKYGIPMLDKMNMGALPRYSVPQNNMAIGDVQKQALSVFMPQYTDAGYNNVSVNVNVPNTNASPDAIANRVVRKIQDINRRGIGNERVYKQ